MFNIMDQTLVVLLIILSVSPCVCTMYMAWLSSYPISTSIAFTLSNILESECIVAFLYRHTNSIHDKPTKWSYVSALLFLALANGLVSCIFYLTNIWHVYIWVICVGFRTLSVGNAVYVYAF